MTFVIKSVLPEVNLSSFTNSATANRQSEVLAAHNKNVVLDLKDLAVGGFFFITPDNIEG